MPSGGGMAMPMPTVTTSVLSPSLAGADPVTSGINVNSFLSPAWGTGVLPGPEAPGIEGAFRFVCMPSHNAYDDPIVYPGQPGMSHLHTFFGNTDADANSTYKSLRTTGGSTCNNVLNRSSYWMPSMMHVTGKVVMPDWISIYYKRAPAGSEECRKQPKGCLAIPRGLRYVFGYDMQNPAKSAPAIYRWFNCTGAGAVEGHFATIAEAAKGCPAGSHLGAVIVGPNCWNGRELDSSDHRSHMAYQSYGDWGYAKCPDTHPYLIPFFELGAWFSNDGTAAQWKLSSDLMMGSAGGVTMHADWFGAWEDSVKDLWTANCIDAAASCSGGDLGDGRQITAMGPAIARPTPALMDPPARPQ